MSEPSEGAERRPAVLVVDDDEHNLVVTAALLEDECFVRVARGGTEALALLDESPADVVLADQRMPGLSGVELLERVRALCPDAARMIVTAYADVGDILDAINRGHVQRYVLKPWRPEELRLTVRQLAESVHERRERRRLTGELDRTVTELRVRNEQLERTLDRARAAERLALVGRFAAETGHEMGNLVQIVSGIAETLGLHERPEDGAAQVALRESADRLAELVGVLRDLAGGVRAECRPRPEDVAALVRQTVELARHHPAAAGRTLDVDAPAVLVWPVDRRLLRHLVLNLLRNACEAARSRVCVALDHEHGTMRLAVEDDGPGVAPGFRARLFEPFQTTKPDGLGLGLSVCLQAAREHGGVLSVEDAPGGGARFVAVLPLVARPDAALAARGGGPADVARPAMP